MNAAVVDTDVVSMLFKGDTRAAGFTRHLSSRLLGISFMTLAELYRWSLQRNWGPSRRTDFDRYITKYAVLPVSRELCAQWARVTYSAQKIGRPIQTADAWIAATALHYQVPLITNNVADYATIEGLSVLSAS